MIVRHPSSRCCHYFSLQYWAAFIRTFDIFANHCPKKYFYTFNKYYHGQVLAAVVRTFYIELPIIVREKLLHQSHAALTDVVHAQAAVVVGVQAAT